MLIGNIDTKSHELVGAWKAKRRVLWLKMAVTVGPKLDVLWPDTEAVRKLRGQIIWENLCLSNSDFKSVGLCRPRAFMAVGNNGAEREATKNLSLDGTLL